MYRRQHAFNGKKGKGDERKETGKKKKENEITWIR